MKNLIVNSYTDLIAELKAAEQILQNESLDPAQRLARFHEIIDDARAKHRERISVCTNQMDNVYLSMWNPRAVSGVESR